MRIGLLAERIQRGFGMDRVLTHLLQGLHEAGHETVTWVVHPDTLPHLPGEVRVLGIEQSRPYLAYETRALRALKPWQGHGIEGWVVASLPFHSALPFVKNGVVLDFGLPSSENMEPQAKSDFAAMGWLQHQLCWGRAKGILTLSDFLKNSLPISLRKKTTVLPLGGNLEGTMHSKEEARSLLGLPQKGVLPLWVGHVDFKGQPYKGVETLLRLGKILEQEVNHFLPLAVGQGPDLPYLQEAGWSVFESVDDDLLSTLYQAADLVWSASTWEGFNLPLAEAQKWGCPVLALSSGAHPEVVWDRQSGLLVGHKEGLREGFFQVLEEKEMMGKAASKWGERFSWAEWRQEAARWVGRILENETAPIQVGRW